MEKVILTVNIPTTYDMLSNEEKILWQENKYIREYASKLYTYLSKISNQVISLVATLRSDEEEGD